MADEIELIYFTLQGRGTIIRMLLNISGTGSPNLIKCIILSDLWSFDLEIISLCTKFYYDLYNSLKSPWDNSNKLVNALLSN